MFFHPTFAELVASSLTPFYKALRRAASTLEDNREVDEELVGDHVGMCRFGSASDSGFRSISSYISRLVHHQALRVRTPPYMFGLGRILRKTDN